MFKNDQENRLKAGGMGEPNESAKMAAENTNVWQLKKELGNDQYKNGRFDEAIESWNMSLSMLNDVSETETLPEPIEDRDQQVSVFFIYAFVDEANDFRFSPRCFDNQQARDLANAALSGSSTDIARLLSSNGSANHGAVSETNKAKSMLLANIAQAKIQLKDSTGAIRACNEALEFDPTNMKVTELSLSLSLSRFQSFQSDIFFMICQSFFFLFSLLPH
jgi:tetratricopeptide (TPR) repeat protein